MSLSLLQVVRRPVVAVGNSIGGYISASLAGDYPTLVRGLVLVNSAGRLDPGYAPAGPDADPEPAAGPPRIVVDLLSRALFLYLERRRDPSLRTYNLGMGSHYLVVPSNRSLGGRPYLRKRLCRQL